jgi:hypothetical protein
MLPVHGGWNFLRGVSLLCFAALPAHAEIVVDGRIDESEWENAIRCEDWRRTVPFARDEPRYRNDVRILSTEHGLAAAFIVDQPPQERRIKPRTPRDAEAFIGVPSGWSSISTPTHRSATSSQSRSAAACATGW